MDSSIDKAAWGRNQKISEEKVLAEVLTEAGFNGIKLLSDATTGTKAAVSLSLPCSRADTYSLLHTGSEGKLEGEY